MVEAEVTATLDDFEANLGEHVKSFLSPLFELFEFFQLDDHVYESIVNEFVAGRVT